MSGANLPGARQRLPKIRTTPVPRGRILGVRTGQLIATEVAAVGVLLGALTGTIALAAAVAFAIVVLGLTWLRMSGRWAFEWVSTAMRYSRRPHTVPPDAGHTGPLGLVAAGSRLEPAELGGDQAAIIVDDRGVTAVLELGDPAELLIEDLPLLPTPTSLLPTAAAEHPPVRIQLLLTGAPAPTVRTGSGTPANSYRQLTEGRLLGHSRTLLAVRVLRAEGWTELDLRRALSGLVRKLPRRLGPVPARPLGDAAAVQVMAEVAHDDGLSGARETWPGLRIGGLAQATFRLDRWPDLRVETSRRLVSRMLALPAVATTVALTAGPRPETGTGTAPVDFTVRVAAADPAGLALAIQALRKLLAAERAHARRLDGEHSAGLIATLPLGGGETADMPGRAAEQALPAEAVEGLELPIGAAGLMLGSNRHGVPVVVRMFRPEQTRMLLVGGVRCAQLIAFRAMALGARVAVQTARPQAWDPFVRGAAVPGDAIGLVPPGRQIQIPPGSALYPLLMVVDVGPVGADNRPGAGWQATLVVRDDFSPADIDVASRADLLLLQPLRLEEANLVGGSLGLGEATQWLTRIRADMLALVNRRAIRWAALSETPIEHQLIGAPTRD
jgi:ESX secretion system protein EccE